MGATCKWRLTCCWREGVCHQVCWSVSWSLCLGVFSGCQILCLSVSSASQACAWAQSVGSSVGVCIWACALVHSVSVRRSECFGGGGGGGGGWLLQKPFSWSETELVWLQKSMICYSKTELFWLKSLFLWGKLNFFWAKVLTVICKFLAARTDSMLLYACRFLVLMLMGIVTRSACELYGEGGSVASIWLWIDRTRGIERTRGKLWGHDCFSMLAWGVSNVFVALFFYFIY